MWWDGGMAIHILNLALNIGEWLALCISHITHMERPQPLASTHCIEVWAYPTLGLENLEKRRISSNQTAMSSLFCP
jgi:hypothetical protein